MYQEIFLVCSQNGRVLMLLCAVAIHNLVLRAGTLVVLGLLSTEKKERK